MHRQPKKKKNFHTLLLTSGCRETENVSFFWEYE